MKLLAFVKLQRFLLLHHTFESFTQKNKNLFISWWNMSIATANDENFYEVRAKNVLFPFTIAIWGPVHGFIISLPPVHEHHSVSTQVAAHLACSSPHCDPVNTPCRSDTGSKSNMVLGSICWPYPALHTSLLPHAPPPRPPWQTLLLQLHRVF